jgi:hypothetical protein
MYPREITEKLNKLSKEVFGSKSKWRRFVENGVSEAVTEDTKRLLIKDGKEETDYVKTQVLHKDSVPLSTIKRYTVSEIEQYMVQRKAQKEQFIAAIQKMQQDKKIQEEAKSRIITEASGTAV